MRILLTGASGGIGTALARALARGGHSLLLQGRRETDLAELKSSLGEADCESVRADLTDTADRQRLCEHARAFAVDTLCTNAGINQFGAFADSDVSAIIDVNVTATLLLAQALLPLLLAADRPRIIVIGSAFGAIGFPGYAAYSASKFALRGFTEALAREYADTALKVHYISPRATDTPMNNSRVTALNAELGTQTDTPEVVASQVLRALHNDRRRLQLGTAENLQTRLNALFPGLVDRALRAKLPIIKKYFKEIGHDEKKILFAMMLLPAALFAQGAALDDIQREWAQANYELEDQAQVEALAALRERTEAAVAASQGRDASLLIWDGIVKSTLAGKKGGLSALSLVKEAKKSLEKAIDIDPTALDGSAYTSLGALYYQVPGWPLGFGNDDTARELLNRAVAMNPNGIDSNYFYGEFLAQQKETAAARAALEHALEAPDRPSRPVADAGRRAEIRRLLDTLSE